MSRSEMRRQFVFFPEILSGTGEYCFSPRIAAQVGSEIEDAIEVSMERSILAAGGGTLQRLFHYILGNDRLPPMGAILRWIGLKIKTQRARALAFVRLKSCQLTDLVPCHHSRSFENKMLVLGPLD